MDERTNKWWLDTLSVLVAVMPLSFSVSSHAKALPALLLLIAGLTLIFSRASTRASYRPVWPVIAVCLLSLTYTALNILGHGLGWNAFDLASHILLYLGTAAVFSLPLRMRWVWLGFSATAIFLGAVCIVQHFFLGVDRAFGLNGGNWGAIEFAMVLLVLSLCGWLQLFYANVGPLEKTVHGLGATLALYGGLLTQSRGPLLAFLPILLFMLTIYARRTRRWKLASLWVTAILVGGVLAANSVHDINAPDAAPATASVPAASVAQTPPATQTPSAHTGGKAPVISEPATAIPTDPTAAASASSSDSRSVFVKRFADVGSEIHSYKPRTVASGAVRERLEMWHVAGHAFADHPLAGIGIDQFGTYIRQQVAEGHANPAIAKYEHPHNEYLEAAATGGVPGLVVILLVFAVPLIYFTRHALHAPDGKIIPACVGAATVGMYALCALTDNVFYRAMPHSFYFFLIPGLAVLVGRIEVPTGVLRRE